MGGLLVFLSRHGFIERGLKRFHLCSELAFVGAISGSLADMSRALVHVCEHAGQAVGEGHVTLATAEAAGLLEIRLGEAADGAFLRTRAFLELLGGAETQKKIGEREARRVIHALRLRARFAE